MELTTRALAAFGVATLALALGACSRDGGKEAREAAAAARAREAAARVEDPTRDWVSAVSPGKGAPVELKFALKQRPEVGKPVDLNIAVLPVTEIERLSATFQAGPGLQLQRGQQMAASQRPPIGEVLPHLITLVPERDGIFFVSAVVLADTAGVSLARTFSIPVIAGEGQPQPPGEPAPKPSAEPPPTTSADTRSP